MKQPFKKHSTTFPESHVCVWQACTTYDAARENFSCGTWELSQLQKTLQKPASSIIVVPEFFPDYCTTKWTFAARGKFTLINLALQAFELCRPGIWKPQCTCYTFGDMQMV